MSLQTFFDNFAQLADAPNGVAKLRELILQLAVQGKLLAQHADEPAGNDLLKKLLKDGRKSKLNGFAESDLEVHSWVMPKSWAITNLESASYGKGIFADGDWVETKDQDPSGDIRLIQLADVGDGKYRDRSSRFMNEETAIRLNCTFLATNDVLIARMPDPIGRACIFPGDAKKSVTVVDVCILRANTDYFIPEFLVIAINSPVFRKLIESKITGTTRSRISRGNLARLPIPILALEEQKRIVAKVEELMQLCDELATRQQARRETRIRLNNATLAPLNNVASLAPEEFEQVFTRLADTFDALYDFAETVGKLRSTILQLAVQGKLVPQDPNDEPALLSLKGIRRERDRLIKERKLKQDKPLPQLAEAEKPFRSPIGWEWAKLDSLCYLITDGTHYTPTYIRSGVPFLSVKDVSGGKLDFSNTRFISRKEHEELSKRCKPEFEDILFTKVGTTGIAKVIDVETEFSIFVSLALLKFSKEYLSPYFLELLLNSPLVKDQSERDTQGVGNKNLVLKYIKNFAVPVPPLEEQKRIVAKVNQLMSLCDHLETKLRQAEADRETLMNAAVQHVLASVTTSTRKAHSTSTQ